MERKSDCRNSSGLLFCERDWNEGGHGTRGVKSNETNDRWLLPSTLNFLIHCSMTIQIAKKGDSIRKDALHHDTAEVRGQKAAQQRNAQDFIWF